LDRLISFFIAIINLAIVRALSRFLNLRIIFLKQFGMPEVASFISQGIEYDNDNSIDDVDNSRFFFSFPHLKYSKYSVNQHL
jgi:hypothetical protein